MLVIKQKLIMRSDIQANRNVLYVFGDNLDRAGMGGQAKEMRGEPNSFGIATKRAISHGFPEDYFFDTQIDAPKIIEEEFDRLVKELSIKIEEPYSWRPKWKAVVIPADGLGTGLSRLPENAPNLITYIDQRIEQLAKI